MLKNTSPYELGATLYMPVLKTDAIEYIAGTKLPALRSMVLCLEDALLEVDIAAGLQKLSYILQTIGTVKSALTGRRFPLVFVRPRDLEMAKRIAGMNGIQHIDGFVAPKMRPGEYTNWIDAVRGTDLHLMPTLETMDAFDVGAMKGMRDEFLSCAPERILALRIGGNDLMSALGLRRSEGSILYEGPLFYTVSMIMSIMKPSGFSMTSPVFEHFNDVFLLEQEVKRDVEFGFVGKTVIHPSQINIVQNAFKVSEYDFDAANQILAKDAPAVFKFGGSMCEPATHRKWAQCILSRADVYGIDKTVDIGEKIAVLA